MANRKPYEKTVTVTFKVKHTEGPRPQDLGDLHRWIEEEWEGLEVYFQGDEEKDDESVVELAVVGFEEK
ncbi:hypothetical protein OIU91_16565 [Streptomyces sp. NBC_01456]|uniref:hypothetical protein n=1 Tax=Streptomyces sp. NBC_01456 TaxID=2975868 RepID=UPI002E308EAA|nr:hypothetical protein [Streptomyces sp. NBC_01456]